MCSVFRPRFLLPVSALALTVLFLSHPQAAADGFAQGVGLCLNTLLPALFPLFVVCALVAGGRCGGLVAALLLSWLGGYAVCAGFVRDLRARNLCAEIQARMLLLLGCCSGPGFVIGSVGGHFLGSVGLGAVLYIAQILANLVCALVLYPFIRRSAPGSRRHSPEGQPAADIVHLPDAINRGVSNSLCVCGSVVFFRMVQAVAVESFSLPPALSPLLSAGLEISSGCADFAQAGGAAALYGICLCLSVLGISVFTQIQAILGTSGDIKFLFACRLLHLPVMLLLVRGAIHFLPGEAAVFSSLQERVVPMNRVSPDAALMVFAFLCAVLYKARKKNYNGNIPRT